MNDSYQYLDAECPEKSYVYISKARTRIRATNARIRATNARIRACKRTHTYIEILVFGEHRDSNMGLRLRVMW